VRELRYIVMIDDREETQVCHKSLTVSIAEVYTGEVHTYSLFSSLNAVLIKADSFAITPRSSAAVLQARTFRISCCNFWDMFEQRGGLI
jgi:hypothetical protein